MKIYISPSSQDENEGAGSYGNEADRMQELSDLLVPKLKAAGHDVYGAPSNRGVKTTYLYETTYTNAVACLIEAGFHDQPEDAKWIVDNLDEIAQAICDAVKAY